LTQFSDLGLAEVLARALRDANYVTPTPIQAQAIPPLLEGRDLLGIAQTGTGKTAAFALPILDRLVRERQPAQPGRVRALVLAPTRELAAQIAESFRTYGRHAGIKVGCVVGGVSAGPQIAALARGLDVLVATPGRLLDHLTAGKVRLDMTRVVVLDEADHMLDLGFVIPIRKILAKLPRERQNLFFSATMPREIAGLAAEMLHNPVRVSVTPAATTVERITQQVFLIEAGAKADLLVELLGDAKLRRTIVFTRTKRGADKVARRLEVAAIPAIAIHGNKSQNQRQRAMADFKTGAVRVLVATDIAARGIDVEGVTHVVNFELPDVPEAYVHRIGRTARAGADGAALAFCDGSERDLLRAIERTTRQAIPVVDRRGTVAVTRLPAAAPERAEPHRRGQNRPAGKPSSSPGKAHPRGGDARRDGAKEKVWSNQPDRHRRDAQHQNRNRASGQGHKTP
jgi:ATP-dependent RNA helicase RhlE